MKRSRGQSRPRPGDDAVFPFFFFISIFFFSIFLAVPGYREMRPQNVPGLREIFSDIDFSDFYTIFLTLSAR